MTRYCGELQEISGTAGSGYSVTGRSDIKSAQSLRSIGGIFGIAPELPLLIIGNRKFRNIRLCLPVLEDFLREGETACIYVFRHLLHKQVMIGVRSGDGPSWTMSRGRMLATLAGYLLAWPVIAGTPAAFAGWFFSIPFGEHAITLGITLGILFSTGLCWLSALRLVTTWRTMQRG